MADQPKKKVRRVRNPESFRDKAIKAGAAKPKKDRISHIAKPVGSRLSTSVKPLKKASSKVGQTKAGKIIKKPIRIIGIVLFIPYFKNSFKELKQVTWPSWKQSWKLTYAVLAFAIVFGASIAGLDWVLGKIFKQILIK